MNKYEFKITEEFVRKEVESIKNKKKYGELSLMEMTLNMLNTINVNKWLK